MAAGEIGEVLAKFLQACESIDLASVEIRVRVKIKVTELTEAIVRELESAGLEVDRSVLRLDSKIPIPWVSGWIHPRLVGAIADMDMVEYVDFDLVVTPAG
ncbi:MAG: hypothetical protein ACTSVT_04520 [Candidatus Thorarchaeota archaeon]